MGREQEGQEGEELTGWGAGGSRSERLFQDRMAAIESVVSGEQKLPETRVAVWAFLASLSSKLLASLGQWKVADDPGGSRSCVFISLIFVIIQQLV